MKKFLAPAVIVLSMSLFGCASKGPTVGNAVSYGNASDVDQVSLEFGSTDLQMLAEQMTQFFHLIRSGKVATRSDELWKDFLTYRGQAVRGVQRKTESVDTDDYIAAALARQEQA